MPMLTAQPASLSVYRGQSRTGDGEGPGKAVLHGEQYMRVDSRLLNAELLDAIRPWMTLDSDPADHQRLNDQLEGWSLFPVGEYLFVVRLVSAGIYDRRAAYFAHGRVWKRDALPAGFDPGLHLGRSTAFDLPWRDERPPTQIAEDVPAVVRIAQVSAESQTAARFLAHLLQGMVDASPLIIAAPVADFASGSALHALVSVARAGLPASLQRSCRIRVYSRFPELFLRHLGANLLVVPEEAAGGALSARPTATLIDRQGRKIAGKDLADRALDYASAVVERAVAIPDGLPFFTARLRDAFAADARALQITYNLAFAFAGSDDRRAELLRRYLPRAADKLGPGLPWNELIGSEEWRDFPRGALLDELLTDTTALSDGRRELLRAAEDGAARLGLRVDERLADWWDPRDRGKLARLVALLAHDPPLVSDSAAAQRTAEIPLDQLARAGSLAAVLQAEAKSGRLAQRAHESAELARAASDAAVFAVLTQSVRRLEPDWARTYVRTAARDELVEAARRWLDDATFFEDAWSDVPQLLLDRLRSFDPPPATLAAAVTVAALRLDPLDHLESYLRLADLLTRIDREEGRETECVLITELWKKLARIDAAGRALLERVVFDPAWCCIRLPYVALQSLLELASSFRSEASLQRVYEELDARMQRDAATTADALARTGWWFFWRRGSRLRRERDAATLEQSALAWLASPAWTNSSGAEATLEAWNAALADLPRTIEGADLARLRDGAGARRWPWIPPFEEEQFDELIDRAADLGGLAELAEAVLSDRWETADEKSIPSYVLSRSGFGALPPDALGWLIDDRYRVDRPSLTLQESMELYAYAGHREPFALAARIRSVEKTLHRDPHMALRAASDPDLWSDARFLGCVADWMNRKGSLAAIGPEVAKVIDDSVDGEPEPRPRAPSFALVRELVERRFSRAARLLHPELSNDIRKETLADEVIEALLAERIRHSCWQQLAEKIGSERTNHAKHPIGVLAERIRSRPMAPNDRRQLARRGWRTFVTAARDNGALLHADDLSIAKLLELAAVMLPSGALGTAALQLVHTMTNATTRAEVWWWQSLVRAMRGWRRHAALSSADDREDAAFALLFAHLEEREQQALARVLRQQPQWSIPVEFGERTP